MREKGYAVETRAIPPQYFADRLQRDLEQGRGPDVFIDLHHRLGHYVEKDLILPVGPLREPPSRLTTVDWVLQRGGR